MHTTRPFEAPPVLVSDPDMRTEAAEDDEPNEPEPDKIEEDSRPSQGRQYPGSLESEEDK